MTEERTIDSALTSEEAWSLAGDYIAAKRRLGLSSWRIGVRPDPVAGPNGHHGYLIVARLVPEPETAPPAEVPAQRSLPAIQRRHTNRKR